MTILNEDRAVAQLTELIALKHGINPDAARQIRTAAALHDIGKQGIPKSILEKPGKLTEQEFEVVKTHTVIGAKMLSSFQGSLGEMARLIAMYHHEKYNGSGYWNKRTDELPVYISFTAIADVFTALLCTRCYKEPWPPSETLDYIRSQSGEHFDPALVEVFLPLANDKRVMTIFEGRC